MAHRLLGTKVNFYNTMMKNLTIVFVYCFIIGKMMANASNPDVSYIFTPKSQANSTTPNTKVVENFYSAMSQADIEAINATLDSNYKVVDLTASVSSPYNQFDAFSKNIPVRIKSLHQALPKLKLMVNQLIAEKNKVFADVQISGMQMGQFLGVQPTNKPIKIRIFAVFTLNEGKITQICEIWNQLAVMKDMGYIIL
jgi:predicted ester cyclase